MVSEPVAGEVIFCCSCFYNDVGAQVEPWHNCKSQTDPIHLNYATGVYMRCVGCTLGVQRVHRLCRVYMRCVGCTWGV